MTSRGCNNSPTLGGFHSNPNHWGKCTYCGKKIAKSEAEMSRQPQNVRQYGRRVVNSPTAPKQSSGCKKAAVTLFLLSGSALAGFGEVIHHLVS